MITRGKLPIAKNLHNTATRQLPSHMQLKYVLSHMQAPKYVKRTVPRIADPHSISVIIGQLGHVMVDRRHVITLADL